VFIPRLCRIAARRGPKPSSVVIFGMGGEASPSGEAALAAAGARGSLGAVGPDAGDVSDMQAS